MADYTSSNTGAVIDAAVDYVEILDNYLTISSNELIITGQTGVGSDTVLLNLKANNSAGFAGNVLRFTDTDPTAVQNGSMGKVQWFSTTTGAVVAEINGKNDDATPDGQLIISTAAGASLTQRIDINADGDIQFFNATGTSRDLHWDATDSRLGINVTNPTEALDVLGNANFTGTVTASGDVAIGTSSAGTFRTKIKHSAASVTTGLGIEASANDSVLRVFHSGSLAGFNATYSSTGAYVPMVFNVGSGGEAVRISTAGLVGINNSSPVEMLTVGDTSDTNVRVQFLSSASGANTIQFGDGTGTAAYRGYINYTHSDDALAFAAAGSEAMRIVSGNVGINETNPQFKLDVENVGGDAIRINAGADFSGLRLTSTAGEWSVRTASDALIFYDVTSASEVGRFDSSGKFGIGANSIDSDALLHLKSTQPNIRFEDTDDSKSWRLEAGSVFKLQNVTTGSEVFRVDQSSNLLVGTADNEPYNNNTGNADDNGIALSGGGWLASSRFNGVAAYFNRTNTTGDIVTINYNGATKGTIGSDGSILYIGSGEGTDAYLGFGNDIIRPVTSAGASRDAAIDLGYTGMRFKDLYLSGRARAAGSTGLPAFASVTDTDTGMNPDGAGNIQFTTQGSEAARFDSSGNLLVGKSTTAVGTAGTNLAGTSIVISAGSGNTYHVYDTTASNYPFVVTYQGAVTCLSVTETSDERLKKNIIDLCVGLDEIKQLRPVQFDWKDEDLDNGVFGFIAQEVEQTLPSLVTEEIYKENGETRKAIKKNEITAILVKAIQEQQDLIESLTARIAALEGAN